MAISDEISFGSKDDVKVVYHQIEHLRHQANGGICVDVSSGEKRQGFIYTKRGKLEPEVQPRTDAFCIHMDVARKSLAASSTRETDERDICITTFNNSDPTTGAIEMRSYNFSADMKRARIEYTGQNIIDPIPSRGWYHWPFFSFFH